MKQSNGHREAVLQLLEQTRLPQGEVSERLIQALDPAYWEKLNPFLSIGREKHCENIEEMAMSAEAEPQVAERFFREGYFKLDSLLSHTAKEKVKDGVEVVKRAGWPPVFGFVYDQFWLAIRPPSLMRLLTAILGPGYKQSWHLWSHYIHPKRGASGWPAHVDNYHYPDRVTIWIPLSDATLDNGCLFLIPKDLVSNSVVETLYAPGDLVPIADLQVMLQGAEALPVRGGSVLGWQHDVIHWGSCHRGRQEHPRISITSEFISTSSTLREGEIPPLDVSGSLPTFDQRLYAIAAEILNYQRVETLMIRYVDLARRLMAATGGVAMPNRKL